MASKSKTIDLSQYYTAGQAAEVLSQNSGKEIKPSYVRNLARYGVFSPLKINDRYNLYPKAEVDAYKVEDRGDKLGHKRQAKNEQESSVLDESNLTTT